MRKILPYLESLGALLLIIAASFIFGGKDIGFISIKLHPFMAVVVYIASWYGVREGRFAGLAAAVAYIACVYANQKIMSIWVMFEFNAYFPPAVLAFTGFTLGEIRERFKVKAVELQNRINLLEEKFKAADEHLKVLNYTNAELEKAVVGNFSTFSVLYQSAKKLDTTDRRELADAVVDILAHQLHFNAFAMYVRDKDDFVRAGGLWTVEPPERLSQAAGLTQMSIEHKAVRSVRDIAGQRAGNAPPGGVLLAGPLFDSNGRLIGFIEVYDVPFLKFNPNSIRMFEMIVEWIAKTIDRIEEFEWHKSKNILDEALDIYNYMYLQRRLKEEVDRAARYAMPLSLAILQFGDVDQIPAPSLIRLLKSINRILKTHLTDVDIVSKYKTDDRICILMIAKGDEEAAERLEKIRADIAAFDFRPYPDPVRPFQFRAEVDSYQMSDRVQTDLVQRVERKFPAKP